MRPQDNARSSGTPDGPRESAIRTALCYLPPLFFLPALGKSTPTQRFHARQSLILLLALMAFAVSVLVCDLVFGSILGRLVLLGWYFSLLAKFVHYPVGLAGSLLYLALSVGAAVQAAGNQTWRVPVAARYADRLPFWN